MTSKEAQQIIDFAITMGIITEEESKRRIEESGLIEYAEEVLIEVGQEDTTF